MTRKEIAFIKLKQIKKSKFIINKHQNKINRNECWLISKNFKLIEDKYEIFELIFNNKITEIQLLYYISIGGNINDVYGDSTFLGRACYHNNINIVKLLIDNNVYVNQCDSWGTTALMTACYYGYYEIAQLLIQGGADINHQDGYGDNALICACYNGYCKVAKLLIDNGANYNLKNNGGKTALDIAKNNGFDLLENQNDTIPYKNNNDINNKYFNII